MPSKRKNSSNGKKVAKDLDDKLFARSSKRTRNNPDEDEISHADEQIVVVKIKAHYKKTKSTPVEGEEEKSIIKETAPKKSTNTPVPPPAATAPLSAIAARRAAKEAGHYKEPEPEPESDEEEEEEEEDDDINRDGIEVQSVTDEEDIEIREALEEEVLPVSGTTTPNGGSTPMRPSTPIIQQQSTKIKNKIPALMDDASVSKFTPSKNNSCVIDQEGDAYLFIGLKSGEDIVFMGQVLAAPLFGAMSVAGAVISSGREMPKELPTEDLLVPFYPIFSPRTHSLLRIASESLDTPSIQSHYSPIEIDEHLLDAVFDELKDSRHEFESLIVIKDLDGESKLEEMSDAVNSFTKNLVRLSKKEDERDSSMEINFLLGFHPIFKTTPGVKAFKVESSWQSRTDLALQTATERQSPLVSVVCGAKDMGKSSYSRYLINRLLSKYKRVAYIETDVGQSEFTPSGLLSLHYLSSPILGPPFTHQQLEPERSFFFGSASPRNNPDYYLECINELVDHYKKDQASVCDEEENEWIPLVVNTQGWVSGVGYNLLVSQIQKIEPTDVFAMHHHVFEYKNLPRTFNMDILPVANEAFMIAREAPTLHYLDCVLQDTNVVTWMDSFTSIQQRDITLGSYFHQSHMGQDHYLTPKWNFKQHMIERVPWVIDWRQSLNAIWVVYEEVKLNELFYALNGSLVGLIGDVIDFQKQDGPSKKKYEALTNDTFTPPTYYNTQDVAAPSPHKTTCYGLGIVRAIDPSQHAILLLTPLPQSTLEKVSGLVKGEIQLPLWAMLDHRFEKNNSGVANVPWKKVPYITQESTEGAGANALRVRRNLLRRSQQ